jgi:hypothetical protein
MDELNVQSGSPSSPVRVLSCQFTLRPFINAKWADIAIGFLLAVRSSPDGVTLAAPWVTS